jgi:hypothetical protein
MTGTLQGRPEITALDLTTRRDLWKPWKKVGLWKFVENAEKIKDSNSFPSQKVYSIMKDKLELKIQNKMHNTIFYAQNTYYFYFTINQILNNTNQRDFTS